MTEPMTMIQELKTRILNGGMISREEALALYEAPLEELCSAARQIQLHFCQNRFDLCTIINGKSGRCPENCRFCAQSAYSSSSAEEYPLLDADTIVQEAGRNHRQGVPRFSIVTSGRQLNDREVDRMCLAIQRIRKETGCLVCASFGLLDQSQYEKLKEAGVTRIHNNLETSRSNFPNVCTTHTFDQKLAAIKAAQAAGLTVCSGGIVGMGETPEDQVDMALSLRELGIRSVPVNMLNPIPGTPLGHLAPLTGDAPDRGRIPLPSSRCLHPPGWRTGPPSRQRAELFPFRRQCRHLRRYADHLRHLHGCGSSDVKRTGLRPLGSPAVQIPDFRPRSQNRPYPLFPPGSAPLKRRRSRYRPTAPPGPSPPSGAAPYPSA